MNPTIKTYLEKEPVCVLSGILPDGTSHSSTVHFSHQESPFKLFFQTRKTTAKHDALTAGSNNSASVVIGFNENEMVTLQMRGTVRIVSDAKEIEDLTAVHYKKHPSAEKRRGPETIFIEFTPTWWRYSDLKTKPATIISNE